MISPFWRKVRERMKEIAIGLYMHDHLGTGVFNIPEDAELREGGYMDQARVLALREIQLSGKKHKTLKEVREDGE